MRKLLFCALLFLLTSAQKDAEGPVYILHSDQGRLQQEENNEALLVMSEVDQTVPYVYSHPRRRIGAERLPEFMRVWASGNKLEYDSDPPDAHLLFYNSSYGDYVDFFVELIGVDYMEEKNEIQFRIKFSKEESKLKSDLGEVTLFIDCFPFCI